MNRLTKLFARSRSQILIHFVQSYWTMIVLVIVASCAILLWLRNRSSLSLQAITLYPTAIAIGLLCLYSWSVVTPLVCLLFATYVIRRRSCDAWSILVWGLTITCLIFTAFSWNEPENCAPYIFLCSALSIASVRTRGSWQNALLVIGLIDAAIFHFKFNVTRSVHHVVPELKAQQSSLSDQLPPELDWLEWGIWKNYQFAPKDVADLTNFLRTQGAVFWLFGDMTMLYGITNKPSVHPALWYHFGLTVPVPGTPEHVEFQRWTLSSVAKHHTKYVVLEGDHTMAGCYLSDFPLLEEFVYTRSVEVAKFGGFTVREIYESES